ncbi:MaoC family dehydratase [Mycolicibacterium diernhoferi]|uniref:Dehydratase n=1 Tax=Mycolicibacterium diernhoferi TaxID=1801 RepID=A0A1Q4HKY7_9MYCO|nr:MaoC family dehydratase [Mycolicibacterium diernhoferi]OJZ68209.1 dehydratase [Mycolicibacterium diernhoferi]OPE47403.1 dehydratase [Mycolicibacterium diernhoferi]PEG56230.1 dehydratase [Mycolicibacterium diernhoferi]QYL21295.1 MaoC family dehydratase [Mycolicibacterium diernhoferi]
MTEKRIVEQRGLWFEEFEPGVVYRHRPGRTITEADNVLFTTLTMNTQALHLDAAFAEALPPFNARLVNSMFTLSTLVGLSVAQLTQGTIVGNLGFSDIAFPKPVFHGDTLYAESEVIDKRESKSRPGEGIVTFAHTGRNQHGEIVATASRKTMVRKKPQEDQ